MKVNENHSQINMVRPTSVIWKHYITTVVEGKRSKAVCRYCSQSYSFPNATRLAVHLASRCKKCPAIIKSIHQNIGNAQDEGDDEEGNDVELLSHPSIPENEKVPSSSVTASQSSNKPGSSQMQQPIKNFLDTVNSKLQLSIDEALARAVYASGLPLSVFNNPHWIAAFRILRPAYKPPTSHSLGGVLLDSEYLRVMKASEEKIADALCLSLMSDGWTNVRGEGIINFVIGTPMPVFYKAIQREERETGEYIAEQILNILQDVGSEKFMLLVTDNASNMKAAWALVSQRYPHITTIGCCSHSLNLLLNDIMKIKSIQQLYIKAKHIVKSIKNSHVILAAFTKVQKAKYGNKALTLKVPNAIRWGGVVIMMDSLVSNKAALQETIIKEELKIDKDVRQPILDDEIFWVRINTTLALLRPVADGIKCLEADTALLSEVPEVFFRLKEKVISSVKSAPLTKDEEKKITEFVMNRFEFTCKPIHFAANLLDPRYRGEKLSNSDVLDAIDFISAQCSHFDIDEGRALACLGDYRTRNGLWSRPSLWKSGQHTTPAIWWQGLCSNEALCPVAARLLSLTPSSAACERNWSAFGRIHSKSRNKLKTEKVEKLVAIQTNLQFLSPCTSLKQKETSGIIESDTDINIDSNSDSE